MHFKHYVAPATNVSRSSLSCTSRDTPLYQEIPLGEVDASFDFDLLVANGSFLVDAIPDGNVWVDTLGSSWMIVWLVTIITVNFSALGYALYTLYLLKVYERCHIKSVPIVCVVLSMFAIICRLILHAVDPFGSFKVYPFFIVRSAFTISLTFSVTCSVLVALFWHQVLARKDLKVRNYLTKTQYVFYGYFAVLMLITLFNSMAPFISDKRGFSTVSSALLVLTILAALIYCLVIAGIILAKLRLGVEDGQSRKMALKVLYRILVVGASSFAILFFFGLSITSVSDNPVGYVIVWYSFFMFSSVLDLLQIWMVQKSQQKTTTSFSNKSGDKNSTIPTKTKDVVGSPETTLVLT